MKIKDKSISIKYDIQGNLKLKIDATKIINSAFNNILTNSIKFSDKGSTLLIRTFSTKDKIHIEFVDYGRGISKEIQKTLFNKNNKNTRTGTMGEKGTVFGMGLIKESVESFDGKIEVFSPLSDQQTGTRVLLTFPLIEIDR